MFKTYCKIAWRNLLKDRQFTVLNLVGLSTGLACALLIWLWITDEQHVDKYNEKDMQLYQVMQNLKHENDIETTTHTSGMLGNALATEIPEVAYAATVVPASWFGNKGIVSSGNTKFRAGSQFVSKDYFNVFTLPFVHGDQTKLITDKNSVAISTALALKLYHTTNAVVGKTIDWSQGEFSGTYSIAGIFPENSAAVSDKFDILFNFELFKERRPGMENWDNSDPSTFVIIKPYASIDHLNEKLKSFFSNKGRETGKSYFATRFSDRYLHGTYKDGKPAGGRITYIKLFAVIGIFILLIACINFMNLSTAKASRRIKEVGIKKVMGARRTSLALQYLGESVFMSILSLILAIVLIFLFLPGFNSLTGKILNLQFTGGLVLAVCCITLVTGLLAGSYPALYISGFSPARVLKGTLQTAAGELLIRKGLVIFQFTLSVIAIVAVLIVYRQVNFIQSKNLGYNRDNIIHFEIPLENDSAKLRSAASFVDILGNIPGVLRASSYYHNLNGDHGEIGGFEWSGKVIGTDINFANLEVGKGFLETVGIKMKEGRNFSAGPAANHEIVFNEAAIAAMGLKNPIGRTVRFWGMDKQIIGVAADFNFESLYQNVKPCFFQVYPVMPNIIVKIKAGTERTTIAQIQQAYKAFNNGLAFDYRFLDEEYQAMYSAENRVAILSKYFAALAILISSLGLFGLATFTAQRRQKEIGIRKVVGASAASVALMLSKDFVRMVIIAIGIGFPLVAWLMNSWLQEFAYRIPIGASVFVGAGLSVIFITLCTIGFQTVKAAVANPVKSLRTE